LRSLTYLYHLMVHQEVSLCAATTEQRAAGCLSVKSNSIAADWVVPEHV